MRTLLGGILALQISGCCPGDHIIVSGEDVPAEVPDGPHVDHNGVYNTREEVGYKGGWKVGHSIKWYANGQRAAEGEFVHGKREGPWLRWYENGRIEWEGSYTRGRMTGTVTCWNESGSLDQVDTYSSTGEILAASFWYENGRLKSKGEYVDGRPSGRWEDFHEDGTADEERSGIYLDGRKIRD